MSSEGNVQGRIDIFDPEGFYLTSVTASKHPKTIAVDTKGNLYVCDYTHNGGEVVRYRLTPSSNLEAGDISYEAPVLVEKTQETLSPEDGIAINRANDHLFIHRASHIDEYSSAEEGNKLLDSTIGKGILSTPTGNAPGLAVDAAHKRIYASSSPSGKNMVKVFELEAPHELLMTIEGDATPPEEEFAESLSLAADEGTGHFFVYDGEGSNAIYEFDLAGDYVSTIEHDIKHVGEAEIAVDNGEHSPNGELNPFERYLFAPSLVNLKPSHVFAFGPPEPEAPMVESLLFANATEAEAELRATITGEFLATTYRFEYTTLEAFEAEEFNGASEAASGTIPASGSPFEVSASLSGLAPGTTYVFRAVAENEKGKDEAVSEFATFPASEALPACENEAFRIGPSELLPDCRSYELVTPPDTNGRTPIGVDHLGTYFSTRGASPDGNAASFIIEGGSIPGYEATGSYAGDRYVVHRGEAGWSTEYAGPSGEEAPAVLAGSNSPDQGYAFWRTAGGDPVAGGEGSAQIGGEPTTYVRYPDGHSELVGRGELTIDPRALGLLISENGGHIIFLSGNTTGPAIQLEEGAPPSGTATIYDRTPNEATHVVSLLPEDITPAPGESASYEGASLDGKAVAFKIGKTLYFRYNNEETYEIGENVTFAGFAREDRRAFYLEGGNLFAFDVDLAEAEEGPVQFSSSANVTPVNVAPSGNVAYFLSPSVLVGEPNPAGDLPINGQQNLYRSEEGILNFVGTVTKEDVEGVKTGIGLGRWTPHVVSFGEAAEDPSRITSDGQTLLFESEAALTDYDPEGHSEIYRYDSAGNELTCLSCSPTLAPAAGDATLQSATREQGDPEPFSFFAQVNNLRSDGRRAFFQSTEPLVTADTDGFQDVYEWESQGVGSCKRADGCVYLISSGHSHHVDYLWAVSDSGNDVFFRSSDLLVGSDKDETPSIYDARVGGGFPEAAVGEDCGGEGCRPNLTTSPALPTPGMLPDAESGNVPPTCPKGKRRVVRNGNTVCVKKHKRHKKHHRRAGAKRKGAHQ